MASGRVSSGMVSTLDLNGRPALWLMISRMVMGWSAGTSFAPLSAASLWSAADFWSIAPFSCFTCASAATIWPWNSGRYFSTGSSSFTLPSSTSIIMQAVVKALLCEAIQNSSSVRIGILCAMSA